MIMKAIFRHLNLWGWRLKDEDDRQDINRVADPQVLKRAESVAAIFSNLEIVETTDPDYSKLMTVPFFQRHNLCQSERFRQEPTGGSGTAFLVKPDIVLTADHISRRSFNNFVEIMRFVFGFSSFDQNGVVKINNKNIYSGAKLIAHSEEEDWALIQLDRPVTDRDPLQFRSNGAIDNLQAVYIIGHPCGLPTKYAPNAKVIINIKESFFRATLDAYGGNSGSPVFNADNHDVEGILISGSEDFETKYENGKKCHISKVHNFTHVMSKEYLGEKCTRITRLAKFLA